jgi:hypothetical protein
MYSISFIQLSFVMWARISHRCEVIRGTLSSYNSAQCFEVHSDVFISGRINLCVYRAKIGQRLRMSDLAHLDLDTMVTNIRRFPKVAGRLAIETRMTRVRR